MKKLLIVVMLIVVGCFFVVNRGWAFPAGLYEFAETAGSGQATLELFDGSTIVVIDSTIGAPTGTYNFDSYGYVYGSFAGYISHYEVDDSSVNWDTGSVIRVWLPSSGNTFGTLASAGNGGYAAIPEPTTVFIFSSLLGGFGFLTTKFKMLLK